MAADSRAQGLPVVILADEHLPPHVHVFGDGEAKIDILDSGAAPKLIWVDARSCEKVCTAMRVFAEQKEMLIAW